MCFLFYVVFLDVISNAQLSLCVKDGQRPSITDDRYNSLQEAAILMEECWKDDPDERPSFEGKVDNKSLPFCGLPYKNRQKGYNLLIIIV